MPGVNVGEQAPSFRLPSAQGGEIGLEDFRDRKNVIVWFTKGMACMFCRAQMSQLARAYDDVRKLDTEVLQVSLSGVSRARVYATKFKLPFPYLCDADYRVRSEWKLGSRDESFGTYVRRYVAGMRMEPPPNTFGNFMPPFDETRNLLRDDDMGLFIVDKRAIVRYAIAGAYGGVQGVREIPSNDELLRELAKCQTAAA
ncbi:MAG TPA: redoxin domain-containing protein [Candidatus Binatia bacterium]|nr:redoxin domain-containing protein [Candidatus Binatia bacterium]